MKNNKLKAVYLLLLVVFSQVGCSLKTPPAETPRPKDNRFHKSFFVEWDNEKKVEIGKKTFLCGNSYLTTAGRARTFEINNNNNLRNCNNVFEITRNELIARHVNPSEPGQYNKWPIIMSFPITHYNVEKARDAYGRETNKTIETSQFDDFKNQEYIEINYSGMKSINFSSLVADINRVYEVELNKEDGFFGLTADVNLGTRGGISNAFSGALRVNFLEMPKTEGFEPTPYHEVVGKYANVLNIIGGTRPSGEVDAYMGKWNTSKKNKFYINNFPEEYQDVALDVVSDWNDAFEKIGHGRPLEPVIGDEGLEFDLRKSNITWINDRRLSNGGLLGIAQNTADVNTGEMHWGGVSIWVNFLKRLIDNSLPSDAFSEGSAEETRIQLGFAHNSLRFGMGENQIQDSMNSNLSDTVAVVQSKFASELRQAEANLVLLRDQDASEEDLKDFTDLPREDYIQISEYTRQALTRDMPLILQQDFQDFMRKSHAQDEFFKNHSIQSMIAQPSYDETLNYFRESVSTEHDHSGFDAHSILTKIDEKLHPHEGLGCDRSALDYMVAFSGLQEIQDGKFLDKDELFRVVLKFLISHELGHVLGLGHNFKENIMPVKGSVPNAIYEALKARHDNNLTNISSVMGYPSIKTEILMEYEDVIPFVGDIHTMELIYNQKYPMYAVDADGSECFEDEERSDCYMWKSLEFDGKLLESEVVDGKTMVPGYLPFCNNGDAFIGDDPFCQMQDRGSSAVELMDNYIEQYSNFISTGLYNIANNSNTRPFFVEEGNLWWRSLNTFSKMRIFYDYMRRHHDRSIFEIGSVSSEDSYYTEFSEACAQAYEGNFSQIQNEDLRKLFNQETDKNFIDLCYANQKAIKYVGGMLSLSGKDYSVVDYENRNFVWQQLEGEMSYDMGQAYGTWHSLARIPMKFSAALALTLPNAFKAQSYRGTIYPAPIFSYSREDARYHYNTLYPKEYNDALTDGVISNLHFGDDGEDPYIGKTILALGQLQGLLRSSNDTLSLRDPYKKLLLSQTGFNLSRAIITVDKVPNEEDEKIAKKFNATIAQFFGRNASQLKDFYFYTDNQVVLNPPVRSLIYPLSSVNWYSDRAGFMGAIRITYDYDQNNLLSENSLKSQLTQRLKTLTKDCIEGVGEAKNGLKYFFNDSVANPTENQFKGFDFSLRIMENEDQFYHSISEEFRKYYGNAFPENPPNRSTCDKAIKAQNILVTAAGLLNGIYFPEAAELIEKGGQ